VSEAGEWFAETLYPDFQQRFKVEQVLYKGRSKFQEVVVFETRRFGRVLALDGVIQTTEADEFVYHEMLVHLPFLAHGAVRRALIIGGGDGGILEEALKHRIDKCVMVEIDGDVIDVCRKYIPSICGGAFDDHRAEVRVEDGIKYIMETKEKFDVIIVDSTDPQGPSEPLFTDEFYGTCAKRLTPRGIMVTQSGVTFMQAEEAKGTYGRLKRAFPDATFYVAQVPSYAAGFMTLGWGCKSVRPRNTSLAILQQRFAALNIKTRYYTPEVHRAALALPPYIEALKS
jgi:spermidine synthase